MSLNIAGARIIENAAIENGDILVVSQGRAWIMHNSAWSEIPDYAECVTAFIDSLIADIPKYPA